VDGPVRQAGAGWLAALEVARLELGRGGLDTGHSGLVAGVAILEGAVMLCRLLVGSCFSGWPQGEGWGRDDAERALVYANDLLAVGYQRDPIGGFSLKRLRRFCGRYLAQAPPAVGSTAADPSI
jgi:hypothetical protein